MITPEDVRDWPRSPRGKLICPECGGDGWAFFGPRSWIHKHARHVFCLECDRALPLATHGRHHCKPKAAP